MQSDATVANAVVSHTGRAVTVTGYSSNGCPWLSHIHSLSNAADKTLNNLHGKK